jgi:hypothetical protein
MTVGTIGLVAKGVGMSIFSDPKKLQEWAINLANACGGFKIKKSLEVQPPNVEKVNKLLDEFVISFDKTVNARDNDEEE